MAIIISKKAGGGIRNLSELVIDNNKDWAGHFIVNTPLTGYVYDPEGENYSLTGFYDSGNQSNPIYNLIGGKISYLSGVLNINFFPEYRFIYSITGNYNGPMGQNAFFFTDRIQHGIFQYNDNTSQYEEIVQEYLGLYEGDFVEGHTKTWKRYGYFSISKKSGEIPAIEIMIPITDNVAGTGYFHVNSDEVTINTLTGNITLNPSGETTTGKDIEITDNTKGVILKDRTTGTRYRLKVDNGTLGIEAVT